MSRRLRPRAADGPRPWRFHAVALFLCVVGVGMVSRAYYLQVIRGEEFHERRQRQHRLAVEIKPERGEVVDVHGSRLAVSLESESIYVRPPRIENRSLAARKLAAALGWSPQKALQRVTGTRHFQWLDRDVLPGRADAVRALNLDGVGFIGERRRFYPNRELAGQVLGFVGVDSHGLEGLERQYDRYLRGEKNVVLIERDARCRPLDTQGRGNSTGHRGKTLVVTIDRTMQHAAERELERAVKRADADRGMILVMETQTGAIRALAHYPFFNPNAFTESSPAVWRNRAVADLFEPGSTFKVFTVAAALEADVVAPADRFDCEQGSYRVGGRMIHDTHEYGLLDIADIVKFSSNIGCAKIVERLGNEKLYEFLAGCGFGDRSGIDFHGEKAGELREWHTWRAVDASNIAFGQGVSVNLMQLAAAYAAFANGGYRVRPHLVDRVVDDSGWPVYQARALEHRRRCMSPRTAARVLAMLERVVDDDGTAPAARIPGYRVAGKTGTAQKFDRAAKTYSRRDYIASFVGFVPGTRMSGDMFIAVVVEEPRNSIYGGIVAAPAFQRLGAHVLATLNIEPATRVMVAAADCPEMPALPVAAALPVPRGPKAAAAAGAMPDFSGRSVREVLHYLGTLPVPLKITGSGRVVKQRPRPGTELARVEHIELTLAAD
ncbi:MAG: transpeptidase family protein [Deltaproteobacteria bacterium]|nr:transpeptidase family protein [Candidatus Anaeroferrophillacea bacterium]